MVGFWTRSSGVVSKACTLSWLGTLKQQAELASRFANGLPESELSSEPFAKLDCLL